MLPGDFAVPKAGAPRQVASPSVIANRIARISAGESRSVGRLRNALVRLNDAQAT